MEPPPHIFAALVAATHEPASTLFFTPVKLRARIDGWSPERQRRYVAGIAATGRADAASFVAACCAAFALSKRARREARATCREAERLARARDIVRGFTSGISGPGLEGAKGA